MKFCWPKAKAKKHKAKKLHSRGSLAQQTHGNGQRGKKRQEERERGKQGREREIRDSGRERGREREWNPRTPPGKAQRPNELAQPTGFASHGWAPHRATRGGNKRDQSRAEQRSVAQKQNCSQTFSSGGCSIVRIMLQIYEKT